MSNVEQNLAAWRSDRVTSIPLGGLISRNPIAYKWKAPFRCWVLREAALWRVTDLLTQSYELHQQGHGLGARILLRSGFETVATLLYLNHNILAVIEETLEFHRFSSLTIRQVIGSKNRPNSHDAVNILTMLDKGNKRYPGLRNIYDSLSESAHPNFEGMVWGYSKVDHDKHETNFSNRWMDLYGEQHLTQLELCMMTFHQEYSNVWPAQMEKLEDWIVKNDTMLQKTKSDQQPD